MASWYTEDSKTLGRNCLSKEMGFEVGVWNLSSAALLASYFSFRLTWKALRTEVGVKSAGQALALFSEDGPKSGGGALSETLARSLGVQDFLRRPP